jgi:hypothetical protein
MLTQILWKYVKFEVHFKGRYTNIIIIIIIIFISGRFYHPWTLRKNDKARYNISKCNIRSNVLWVTNERQLDSVENDVERDQGEGKWKSEI